MKKYIIITSRRTRQPVQQIPVTGWPQLKILQYIDNLNELWPISEYNIDVITSRF